MQAIRSVVPPLASALLADPSSQASAPYARLSHPGNLYGYAREPCNGWAGAPYGHHPQYAPEQAGGAYAAYGARWRHFSVDGQLTTYAHSGAPTPYAVQGGAPSGASHPGSGGAWPCTPGTADVGSTPTAASPWSTQALMREGSAIAAAGDGAQRDAPMNCTSSPPEHLALQHLQQPGHKGAGDASAPQPPAHMGVRRQSESCPSVYRPSHAAEHAFAPYEQHASWLSPEPHAGSAFASGTAQAAAPLLAAWPQPDAQPPTSSPTAAPAAPAPAPGLPGVQAFPSASGPTAAAAGPASPPRPPSPPPAAMEHAPCSEPLLGGIAAPGGVAVMAVAASGAVAAGGGGGGGMESASPALVDTLDSWLGGGMGPVGRVSCRGGGPAAAPPEGGRDMVMEEVAEAPDGGGEAAEAKVGRAVESGGLRLGDVGPVPQAMCLSPQECEPATATRPPGAASQLLGLQRPQDPMDSVTDVWWS
jgi:hypothetical protein